VRVFWVAADFILYARDFAIPMRHAMWSPVWLVWRPALFPHFVSYMYMLVVRFSFVPIVLSRDSCFFFLLLFVSMLVMKRDIAETDPGVD
jgi:hypothetical protein